MALSNLILPKDYTSKLDIIETEIAIKLAKDTFERELASALSLTRVSAPLFVQPETGLNDDLNGVERPVQFDVADIHADVQIVHSLAKWKRMALARYGFRADTGLYTDMNAIRRDEELDNLHSVYVDQWDWERVITAEERTMETLQSAVHAIMGVLHKTQAVLTERFPVLDSYIPEEITFVSSQELEDRYPDLTPKQREDAAAKEYGAVFISQIGGALKSGKPHDGRAPDYDDWSLNGDIIFWYEPLQTKLEVSSMGIRVDERAMKEQLEKAHATDRAELPFHRDLLAGKMPYTIGGGIGQSRLCMLLLGKAHVGEVQASIWPEEMKEACAKAKIQLL